MKIRTLALASLTLVAGIASAQSSVTLYGRLNITAENTKDAAGKTTRLNNNGSQIGFKGVEDLGGGVAAGFVLEHRLDPTQGTSSNGILAKSTADNFWSGQSEVFLSGGFGTVRLGNYLSPSYFATADVVSMHNHDFGLSSDALYAFVQRSDNKIGFRSPDLIKGLNAEIAYSAKDGTYAEDGYDLAINYSAGAVGVGFGFSKIGEQKQAAIRASGTVGALTLAGLFQRDDGGFGVTYGTRNSARVSAMYTLGASELHANVGHARAYSNVPNSKATQATVGYNYNLSARTKVYGYFTKLFDEGTVYGGDARSVAVGVRHSF